MGEGREKVGLPPGLVFFILVWALVGLELLVAIPEYIVKHWP